MVMGTHGHQRACGAELQQRSVVGYAAWDGPVEAQQLYGCLKAL